MTTQTTSKKIDVLNAKADRILALLMGDPEFPDKPGMIERLRIVEKWQSVEKWALLILATLFITDLGYTLLSIWKNH